METVTAVILVALSAAIGVLVGYVKGFIDGRARERLEPPRHGTLHMKDGPVIVGRPGFTPQQAIDSLLQRASLGVDL